MKSKTVFVVLSLTVLFGLFAGQVLAKPLWQLEIGEKITGTTCVTDDAVYITTWRDHLVALDRKGGDERWKVQLDGHIPGGAVFDNGTLYVGAYTGKLYALDPKTGAEKWMFDMHCSRLYSTPVVADGVVYIGDRCGNFFAINAESGKEIASNKSINWVMGSAAVDGNVVYLGRMDWSIYAYHAKTLDEIWRYRTRTSVLSTPVFDDEKLYCGSNDGNLYALDKKTGRQVWRFQTEGWIECRPTLHNGNVLFSSFDGAVYCLETGHGRPIWHFRTDGEVSSSVVIDSGLCYFGGRDGFLYCLDVNTGEFKWRLDCGGPVIASPAISDGVIYCTTAGGRVFAIDTKSPPKTSKPMGEHDWAKVPAEADIGQMPELTTTDDTLILFLDLAELQEVKGLEHAVYEGQKVQEEPVMTGTPGTWDAVMTEYYGYIHHDPKAGTWKMWYTATEDYPGTADSVGWTNSRHIGLAISTDGLRWTKPVLGLTEFMGSKENNIVFLDGNSPNVLDVSGIPGAKHKWRMYAMSFWPGDKPAGRVKLHISVRESDDLVHWKRITRLPEFMDVATVLLDRNAKNPKHRFKAYGQYTFRMPGYKYDRQLGVATSEDGLKWDRPKIILSSGELGVSDSEEHYLGVTHYGNYFIALYDAMYSNHSCATEMSLSRDGVNFKRTLPGKKFIKVGNYGDYDMSMITISNSFITTEDKHWQYYSASRMNYQEGVGSRSGLGQPWRRTIGLRLWRRDGFTSLAVPTGYETGSLLTRPINVKDPDKHSLVLNLHVANSGTASVSIINAATGNPVVGYQKSDPISGIDRINHVVTFGGRSDLAGLAKHKRVRLRISLTGSESRIYSVRFQQK